MNPHRLAYGFAYDFPWVMIVEGTTLAAFAFSRESKKVPLNTTTALWIFFVLWMSVTTLFALHPQPAQAEWSQTMKTQVLAVISLMMLTSRERITYLVWIIALSLGFYGVKGGLFSLLTGGQYRVWGPPASFIYGNNEIALALVTVLPLIRFLHLEVQDKRVKLGLLGAIGLCALAALTSFSRGALLASAAMAAMLWFKSGRNKLGSLIIIGLLGATFLSFMPAEWWERMGTIGSYQEDASAMGRINAWSFAINLASDRLMGGGYQAFAPDLFLRYGPDPLDWHDAHSIYFQVLGEHGWPGLLLFLGLGASVMLGARRIEVRTRNVPELRWMHSLAAMLQVCLVGFAVGGAFLTLAYFDLLYHLIAIVLALGALSTQQLAALPKPAATESVPAKRGVGPPPPDASSPQPVAAEGRRRRYRFRGGAVD
jgi:probable O-glycosylation ligase (exosortase A-associated)